MNLKFGTGGLRAKMAPGLDYLNKETIKEATLGVAAYAKRFWEQPKIAIAYDSRENSEKFAAETAQVFSSQGCQVFLYPKLMPTPALSFAVRHLKCDLGIAITASHNPKEYNGYKVYDADGCQITGETAKQIQDEISRGNNAEESLKCGEIHKISKDVKEEFLQEILRLRTTDQRLNNLKVVYTPLNGTGAECVTELLTAIGVEKLYLVKEQMEPDGNFPTCPCPNPEEEEALELGISYCKACGADVLLATDPDCDRVGVAAKKGETYERLTGNQVGVLLLDYLLHTLLQKQKLPKNAVMIKTIVTTSMAEKIAEDYGVKVINTLTGFKYIGEQIGLLEERGELDRFIFGMEESCGYLIGPYVRDKDAVGAIMMICEMAAAYQSRGKTLWDRLEELYGIYEVHETALETRRYEADEAKIYMRKLRAHLKSGKAAEFEGVPVENYLDYLEGIDNLPKADVLKLKLTDKSEIVIRPSGTEPKLKLYRETVH